MSPDDKARIFINIEVGYGQILITVLIFQT